MTGIDGGFTRFIEQADGMRFSASALRTRFAVFTGKAAFAGVSALAVFALRANQAGRGCDRARRHLRRMPRTRTRVNRSVMAFPKCWPLLPLLLPNPLVRGRTRRHSGVPASAS